MPETQKQDDSGQTCANLEEYGGFAVNCMATPFPSSSRMDAWSQRRGLQAVSIEATVLEKERQLFFFFNLVFLSYRADKWLTCLI